MKLSVLQRIIEEMLTKGEATPDSSVAVLAVGEVIPYQLDKITAETHENGTSTVWLKVSAY